MLQMSALPITYCKKPAFLIQSHIENEAADSAPKAFYSKWNEPLHGRHM